MSDIEEQYNNYCYDNYYEEEIDWDAYYEHLAEIEDREWEDNCDE